MRGAFAGHDVCEKDRWVRALKNSRPSKQNQAMVIDTGSFHPNEAGQRAYAEAPARSPDDVF